MLVRYGHLRLTLHVVMWSLSCLTTRKWYYLCLLFDILLQQFSHGSRGLLSTQQRVYALLKD